MSSVPARRSPMKPYICAETSRTRSHSRTATVRIRVSTPSAASANTRKATPARRLSRATTTTMPTSRSRLPKTFTTKEEKNVASATTSPSMRSMSSPEVRALWNVWSRWSTWRRRSMRALFVAAVAGERIEDLREEGDAHEDERDRHEAAHLGARERAVDEPAQQLRVRDLQPDGQQEQE